MRLNTDSSPIYIQCLKNIEISLQKNIAELIGSNITNYARLYARLRLLKNASTFSSLQVLYTTNLSFTRFVILFGFKVNYIARIPCQIIRDLIFRRILQRYSLDISQRSLQSDRLLNSWLIPLLVVFLETSRYFLALSSLLVLSDRIIYSTSKKFFLFILSILIQRFLNLTNILKTRNAKM